MHNSATERRPRGPSNVCPLCGGDWFRETDYYRFLKEESLAFSWSTLPALVGQLSREPMIVLVCLCGSPLAPKIGGAFGNFNTERVALRTSLRQALDRLEDLRSARAVLGGLADQPASPEAFAALVSRLQNVERVLARRMRSGPGRPWQSPERKPLAKGRDQLVIAVEQRAGLTARQAKNVVDQFWKVITRALRRGEKVRTPLGAFQAVSGPAAQKRTRWGKEQTLYRRERRIVFRPSRLVLMAVSETPASKEDSVPDMSIPVNQLICEKCGSTHFVEAKFDQYEERYESTPSAEYFAVTEGSIRALVCLCGHPILPGKLRKLSISRQNWDSFQKSFESARRFRDAADPQTIINRISPTLVSREEYNKLAGQIANLETILRVRLPDSAPLPDVPPGASGS
jgi:nucleoid DNA-binding protein